MLSAEALALCNGNKTEAARMLGIPRTTLISRLKAAQEQIAHNLLSIPFTKAAIPSANEPIEVLLARREAAFARKDANEEARKLQTVHINMDGPIAITHFGDPHVDDDGCDITALRRTLQAVKNTEGMFAANVGDLQNNWVGRLAHLWGQQSTSAAEAWRLTEWLVKEVPWLYMVGGNHDAWSGTGDPLQWMMDGQQGVFDYDGVRLNLVFPNGRNIRVNCRHDFKGNSMYNPVHGPAKAAILGWRDHILTCGHLHISGYMPLKDPVSGLITHVLRVPGFKKWDSYAKQQGFPDQNISPTATTIIDPSKADNDPAQITVIQDVHVAAKFLTYLRSECVSNGR